MTDQNWYIDHFWKLQSSSIDTVPRGYDSATACILLSRVGGCGGYFRLISLQLSFPSKTEPRPTP